MKVYSRRSGRSPLPIRAALVVPLVVGSSLWLGSPPTDAQPAPSPSTPSKPAPAGATLLGAGWGAEHVIVMTREIEATRRAFAALGFAATPHDTVSKVLFHSLIRFQNGTYLELTQFVRDPSTAKKDASSGHQVFLDRYGAFVKKREGGKHVGISVSPAAQTTRLLRERGFEVTDPIGDTAGWDQTRSPTPDWWAVDFLKPKGVTEWLSFIEYAHSDRMLAAQKEYDAAGLRKHVEEHFNTALALTEVLIAVPDLEAEAKVLEKVGFTREGPVERRHLGGQGVRFDAGRVKLVLLTPSEAKDSALAKWVKRHGAGILGVRIQVQDIRRALALVRERHRGKSSVVNNFVEEGVRGFVVDEAFAGGLLLELWMSE